MAAERTPISRQPPQVSPPSTAELIDRLSQFEGPPEQFLVNLLAVQCHIASAAAGAILRVGASGAAEAVAVFPPVRPGSTAPVWLAQSVEYVPKVISSGTGRVAPLHRPDEMYGQPPDQHLVLLPLKAAGGVRGVGAFLIETDDPTELAVRRERLELTISLLSLYEMRLTLQRRRQDLQRLRTAMDVLAAVNENDRFTAAAMALCNEMASQWNCERVSVGLLKGRYVQLKATSHTEKFSRKMKLIQDIEAAMAACLDQDVEILHRAEPDATYVSRAAAQLSSRHGPSNVLSLPLRREGQVIGAVTLERASDMPFTTEQIESIRLTCELVTARLYDLYNLDRWFGARLAADARKVASEFAGPKHTWLKVAAMAAFAIIVFLTFARGTYHADAPFVMQATGRHVVTAPYDGFLKEVYVEPADRVAAGQTLAKLETAELQQRLAAARAQQVSYLKQAADASQNDRLAEAQMAQAQAEAAAAQVRLLSRQINQANIVSPIDGTIIAGDLKQQIGGPVQMGTVLFEVAPLESLRAELSVPEDQIVDVREGQHGYLATATYPQKRIEFVVERINPVAEVVAQRNVFKVRVKLAEQPDWLRPGMEGTAKIEIGQRSYVWLWTRKLRNWLRMKLWW